MIAPRLSDLLNKSSLLARCNSRHGRYAQIKIDGPKMGDSLFILSDKEFSHVCSEVV
jgi:hypothetical protein